jgi:hypothetical protein
MITNQPFMILGICQVYFSEKARAPAYTDRILYKGDMRLIEYERGEQLMSDHRPSYYLIYFSKSHIRDKC